jgi:hypothetical protein
MERKYAVESKSGEDTQGVSIRKTYTKLHFEAAELYAREVVASYLLEDSTLPVDHFRLPMARWS